MTSPQASGSSSTPAQEFKVRAPKGLNKKLSVMKFSRANNVDFTKCGPVKIERENNLRQYKMANDLEQMPKFGAGSEFGREQKEEAKRKKYGVRLRQYNPEDQPWILKAGQGKQTRKFKGTKEGGISENTSYFIFTQCPDGAFEAVPISDWYSFTPVINYRFLNMDEAEEEFERRDKTLNYFSLMLKKRIKNEDEGDDGDIDEGEGSKKQKGKKEKKKKSGFTLMDMDEWSDDNAAEDDEDSDDENAMDDEGQKKEKNKKGKTSSRRPVKNSKRNDDDEAIEESDEGDYDDKEVDYITDSESTDDSDLDILGDKYREQGVVDEDGLRKLNESGESEEEEGEKKPDEENTNEEKKEKTKEAESDSESSSDSSDSEDSDDLEQDSKFSSALLLGGANKCKKDTEKKRSGASSNSNSRSSTPTITALEEEKARKRKLDTGSPVAAKKKKTDGVLHPSASAPSLTSMVHSSEGITEENVRRYLTRKPMTTKDLLQKFKSKAPGVSNDRLVTTMAQILKKINPEKTTLKGKMYLYLKKP